MATDKLAALKVSLTNFLTGIKAYVAPDKAAAYDAFVADRLSVFDTNTDLRAQNQANREQCKAIRKSMREEIQQKAQAIKHVLSDATRNMINAKLDAIPADQKDAFYQKLISRIDVLLEQPRSDRVKAML